MSTRTFRVLVILDIALALMAVLADFAFQGTLPAALQDYLKAEQDAEFNNSPGMWILIVGAMSVLGLGLAATVGLLLLWRPARLLYTLTYAVSWLLYLFVGASVVTAPAHMLYDMSSFLAGVIWALIYFSPLKIHFEPAGEPLAP